MVEDTLRVLLVEDSAPLAELVRAWLTRLAEPAMHVHHVTRLEVALEYLGGDVRVDALLLDLSLPDSGGLDTLRRVLDHAPDVPVLVLTGESDPEAAVGAMRLGARDYLLKAHMDDATLRRAILDAVSRQGGEATPPAQTRIDGLRSTLVRHLEDPSTEAFQHLVTKYVEILSADARQGMSGQERGEGIASLAAALQRMGAGPGDVMVLHEQALDHLDPTVAHLGDAEARALVLLELMGRLVTAYRKA